jgi:hypothetical protein
MRSTAVRWLLPFAAGVVATSALRPFVGSVTAQTTGDSKSARTASLAMQIAGQGRVEEHPPGQLDGARFEGRFVIWAMNGGEGPVFGEEVSLFDQKCVQQHGRGPQCAHFVALRSGSVLETFSTGEEGFAGHLVGRTTSKTRLRIYYDPQPDGSRRYEDRASFLKGELVATYKAEEFAQFDAKGDTFDTRVSYTLLESKPFTFKDRTVDLADLAPRMSELSHGRMPKTSPQPEPIPHEEEPFSLKGPGHFTDRFPVGGTLLSAD